MKKPKRSIGIIFEEYFSLSPNMEKTWWQLTWLSFWYYYKGLTLSTQCNKTQIYYTIVKTLRCVSCSILLYHTLWLGRVSLSRWVFSAYPIAMGRLINIVCLSALWTAVLHYNCTMNIMLRHWGRVGEIQTQIFNIF